MTTISAHARVENGRLKIDVPTTLPPGEIDVELRVVQTHSIGPRARIEAILALAGKLEWQGDAMQLQRELRDEWPE